MGFAMGLHKALGTLLWSLCNEASLQMKGLSGVTTQRISFDRN